MHQTQHLEPARPCLKLALAHLTGVVHVFHGSPFQVSPAEASHIVVKQRSSVGLLCAECRERRVDRSTLPRKKISQKSQKTKAPPKKNRLRHLYLPSAMSRSTNRDPSLNGISSDNPLDKKLGFLRCADLFAVFSFPHLGQVARFCFRPLLINRNTDFGGRQCAPTPRT